MSKYFDEAKELHDKISLYHDRPKTDRNIKAAEKCLSRLQNILKNATLSKDGQDDLKVIQTMTGTAIMLVDCMKNH